MGGGDDFEGTKLYGLFDGTVVRRDDPEGMGRVTVKIEGVMDESGWAMPQGTGAAAFGGLAVPPIGAIVYVEFLRGDQQAPTYRPGWIVKPGGVTTAPKEFEDPDVAFWHLGPFRVTVDNREGKRTATFAMVKDTGNGEENLIELTFDADKNSVKLFGTTAVILDSLGIVSIDGNQVQIKGRVVTPRNSPIN